MMNCQSVTIQITRNFFNLSHGIGANKRTEHKIQNRHSILELLECLEYRQCFNEFATKTSSYPFIDKVNRRKRPFLLPYKIIY